MLDGALFARLLFGGNAYILLRNHFIPHSAGWCNGSTLGFDPRNRGSIPCPATFIHTFFRETTISIVKATSRIAIRKI